MKLSDHARTPADGRKWNDHCRLTFCRAIVPRTNRYEASFMPAPRLEAFKVQQDVLPLVPTTRTHEAPCPRLLDFRKSATPLAKQRNDHSGSGTHPLFNQTPHRVRAHAALPPDSQASFSVTRHILGHSSRCTCKKIWNPIH